MRKKLRLMLLGCAMALSVSANEPITETGKAQEDWDRLIHAMMKVESEHNPKIVSANGKHVGVLQISPIVVKDCNRILKELSIHDRRYNLNDRFDKEKSIEMFNVIQDYYNPERDIEKAIRLWNGGTNYSLSKTNKYYKKVMSEFNRIGVGKE